MKSKLSAGERVRVRMPGKYIVMSCLAAAAIIAGGVIWVERAPSIKSERRAALETVKVGKTHYAPLPEFLVDLSPDQRGRTTYLKLSASIVVTERAREETLQQIADLQPHIIERTTFFLRELQPEDFESAAGMARVKQELLRRVNLVLSPVSADDVVINDLVIQ